jgi:hypothetical protein
MADKEAVVDSAVCRLAEAELGVLRDEAEEMLLDGAVERLKALNPAVNDRSVEECRSEEHHRMLGAAEVYGALRDVEYRFNRAKGLPEPVEFVDIEFTPLAREWLRRERDEWRRSLAEKRGTVEMFEGSAKDTFLLFVLEGVVGGLGSPSEEFPGRWSENPDLAAIEKEGVIALADVGRKYAASLPTDSEWRETFIGISGLDSTKRIAELDRRMAAQGGEG